MDLSAYEPLLIFGDAGIVILIVLVIYGTFFSSPEKDAVIETALTRAEDTAFTVGKASMLIKKANKDGKLNGDAANAAIEVLSDAAIADTEIQAEVEKLD